MVGGEGGGEWGGQGRAGVEGETRDGAGGEASALDPPRLYVYVLPCNLSSTNRLDGAHGVQPLPSVQPDSRGVLFIQVQAWLMVLLAMIVIWWQKIWKLLRPEKPV
eukprot:292430-Chlamydomonas_euryale.AAC.1